MSLDVALATDGFVHVSNVIAPAIVEALRAAVHRLFIAGGPYGVIGHNVWRRDPALMAAAIELDLASLAREALGCSSLVWFQDHLISKPVGEQLPIPWHQDYSFWPLDRAAGLTMWIALDDADVDSGCLTYVAGSHLGGERRPADFGGGAHRLLELEPIDEDLADASGRPVEVRAGDVLLHDPLVWHGSGPNRGDHLRRGWSISWIDPASRWAPDHAPHPLVVELSPAPGSAVIGEMFPRF